MSGKRERERERESERERARERESLILIAVTNLFIHYLHSYALPFSDGEVIRL